MSTRVAHLYSRTYHRQVHHEVPKGSCPSGAGRSQDFKTLLMYRNVYGRIVYSYHVWFIMWIPYITRAHVFLSLANDTGPANALSILFYLSQTLSVWSGRWLLDNTIMIFLDRNTTQAFFQMSMGMSIDIIKTVFY